MDEQKKNTGLIAWVSSVFTKAVPPPLKRLATTETSTMSGWITFYYKKIKIERTRKAKYSDYEIMDDEYPEISTALDTYADNATKEKEEGGDVFEVKTIQPRVKNTLAEMIDRTKLQDIMWDTSRGIAKYGDEFDELVVNDDKLICRIKHLDPFTMFVEVDDYGVLKDKPYVQKDEATGQTVAEFEPWQVCHWKADGLKKMYGESIMKPVRRVYKQLQMMEDGMVIGRLTRSHNRYKILIDVEGMDATERDDYIEKVKTTFRKRRMINPITGTLETTDNPLSAEEDFFIGVTKESKADVGTLQGAMNLGNIRDVEYFQNKLFAGLKIPKAFAGMEGQIKAKATLVEQDIQFARTVGRIRKGLRRGLTQICDYQLILAGIVPTKESYSIVFAPISMVDEMRRWTIDKLKAEVAKLYKVDMAILSDKYILKNFVGVPDGEIDAILRDRPAPPTLPTGKTLPAVATTRAAGMTGAATPAASQKALVTASQDDDGNGNGFNRDGFHIVTYHMLNLVETLKDLIDLEMNK